MKILHLCLGCFYVDNYSYQENMLPKFHKEMGHEVEIIASTLSFDKNGNGCNINPSIYYNEYGIKVVRLAYKKFVPQKIGKFLRIYNDVEVKINDFNPDIIFIHGCQFVDIKKVVNYAKKNKVKIYVDNHADFSNSARNWFSKKILHGIIWKHCAHLIEPYTKKFYGVLPARVDFLINIYKLPKDKVELLVMGADDDIIKSECSINNTKKIREELNIKSDDFVIITGGKIDSAKKQILLLLSATKKINNPKIKVIIFGSIVEDMKEEVMSYFDNNRIKYIGWLNNTETYRYISASDLAVYPGRHSVLWEQTVGIGIPMLAKFWEGTTHVDIGGNIIFLNEDSEKEIKEYIEKILDNKDNIYDNMLKKAKSDLKNKFLYSQIARKSVEIND